MAQLTIYSAGLLATLLAALQLAAWLAMGLALLGEGDTAVELPAALLLGAAICSFLAACFAAAGLLGLAVAVPAALGIGALIAQRRRLGRALQTLGACYRELIGGRLWAILFGAIAFGYWLVALAPPRDADVLRYHLAHVRQIVQDGAWLPIADYHYALPFGWSIGFLPFELLRLPQAAQMLNLGLLIIAVGLLYGLLRDHVQRPIARLLALVFATHTAVLHMATTARADMQLVFVVLALTGLLLRLQRGSLRGAGLLGFVAWVGAQNRYQAVALGLTTLVLLLVLLLRRSVDPRQLAAFAGGGAAAFALSAPFYLFNLAGFGNPFWPLLIGTFNQPPAYADLVAMAYSRSLNGALSPATLGGALLRLLTSPIVFPVPLAALLLLVVALRWRLPPTRALALFTLVFLAVWAVAQPRLYPRFSMMVLVPTLMGWGPVLSSWSRERLLNALVRAGLVGLIAIFGALNLVYASDYLVYAATGDAARFHEHTWYKRTYDWVNGATPADARALVVVTSAQSYYLERQHRRADPQFSGVIDWTAIHGPADLERAMRAGTYTLLIYEDRDWTRMVGGAAMERAVKAALAEGRLRELAAFEERLSTSRLLDESYETTVRVLALQ